MAIPFANTEYVSRSSGSNACCKGAYNARSKITDERTNITYNFQVRGGNVFHEILLPDYVDQKFKDTKLLMNEVEKTEKRKNSQLLKEYLLALPDEKNISLELKKEMIYEFIQELKFIEDGLAVQIDIHEPDKDDKNWHAHLLVTTRRFTQDGKHLGEKARDLEPQVRGGHINSYVLSKLIIPPTETWTIVQNRVFIRHGLENRVDEISSIPQEHIGPVRMRSVLNQAASRNNERRQANIESFKDGGDVLDRITKHNSVFSEKDLLRVVKCVPDKKRANSLVSEALGSDRVIALYNEDRSNSGLYTTEEVRNEELKLMRLGSYINNQQTLTASIRATNLINQNKSLTSEQAAALSHLLLSNSGMRILKGRAGTGKSYVLGEVSRIAKACKIEIVGLSPTHKAKLELAKVGYDKTDTIKGFLFKLYNGKTFLARNSLVVVDEAAMIGNDDFSELLRVAASKECNVILAGDERQLSSIQRGGMFAVYADRFGFTEMTDIRRQEAQWGRNVALAFSQSEAAVGVDILVTKDRLVYKDTKVESIESLLTGWHNSKAELDNKLIIAVKNKDVDLINKAARELLKGSGVLSGPEYLVTQKKASTIVQILGGRLGKRNEDGTSEDLNQQYFMKGERIVFKETNKELDISNGDFGRLVEVSKDQFTVKLDSGKEVIFNPSEFSDFKHGYASTVYKAQGASIFDVYVLHDGFSTMKNIYVAISRHIKDLHLYINREATRDRSQLISQLSLNYDNPASINFLTKEEMLQHDKQPSKKQDKGFLLSLGEKIGGFAKQKITNFFDKHQVNSDYYIFDIPELLQSQVEEVLESADEYSVNIKADNDHYMSNQEVIAGQERAVVGGYNLQANITNTVSTVNAVQTAKTHKVQQVANRSVGRTIEPKARMTAKERFYASVEYQSKKQDSKAKYDNEIESLRSQVKYSSKRIAVALLGQPNQYLSNGTSWRYGEHGKLAIRISGEKAGSWYNFAESKGGDMLKLIQEHKGISFVEAVEFAKEVVANNNIRLEVANVGHKLDEKSILDKQQVRQQAEQTPESSHQQDKQQRVQELYIRSKAIVSETIDYSKVDTIKYSKSDDLNNLLKIHAYKGMENFNISHSTVNTNTKINENINNLNDIYQTRLAKELQLIQQAGYAEDFLIAANIAKICKHFSIRYDIRGSSSSSLTARVLNIHKIDPIKHDLLFERFLGGGNEPDFDFDIDSSKRHIVENYLTHAYSGRAGRMAVLKDTKLTPHVCAVGIKGLDLVNGKTNGLGISNGIFTIDYRECKDVKKFDLLSSKELTRLNEIVESAGIVNQIPMSDSKTYQLIAQGDVEHLFQIKNSGQICQQISPKNFNDLINLVAVIRPGAKHNIEILAGKEKSLLPDPQGLFASTKGVILFQEQIMQAANQYFAVPLEETNQFRKNLAAGKIDSELRNEYISRATTSTNALLKSTKDAEKLFTALEQASNFGFNKAHAVAYAYATYKSAYAKANYRAEFDKVHAAESKQSKAERSNALTRNYFVNHRAIKADLPEDIRFTYQKYDGEVLPTIVAFARNQQGEITGLQSIYLDKYSGNKINTGVAKKSLGQIKGSFVEVQKDLTNEIKGRFKQNEVAKITIIAEGIETALSIKEAELNKATILCSLGVSNIKNYQPKEGERVIIAADNDGVDAASLKVVAEAREILESKGALVSIVMPKILGDFNDILKKHIDSRIEGKSEIKEIFEPVINSFTAKTLEGFWSGQGNSNALTNQVSSDLEYIRKYNVCEDKILAGFKVNNAYGIKELSSTVEMILSAERMVSKEYSHILVDMQIFGRQVDKEAVIGSLANIVEAKRSSYLQDIRVNALHEYIVTKTNAFAKDKENSKKIEDVLQIVSKEQEFLAGLSRDHKEAMKFYGLSHYLLREASIIADQNPRLIHDLSKITAKAQEQGVMTEWEIITTLKSSQNIKNLHATIEKACEVHYIKNNLKMFDKDRDKAKTPEDILKVLGQRQEFLSRLHEKLKYTDHDQNLLNSIKQANTQQKDNIVYQLHKVVQQALNTGAKTKDEIFEELRTTPDIAATHENIDRACEAYHIKSNLEMFNKDRDKAKTPQEMLKVLGQKQEFLSSLHGNLKYSDYQPSLFNSIDQAYQQQKDNIMDDLHKATMHALENKVIPSQELTRFLQETKDPQVTQKELRRVCEDHYVAYINSNLQRFKTDHQIKVAEKNFTSPIEYLQHQIANPPHEFANSQRVIKCLEKNIEIQREKRLERSMDGSSMEM